MNIRFLRIIIAVIIFSGMSLTITGCWDSVEMEQLFIVASVGFDYDPDTQDHLLTCQYIIPQKVKNGGSSSESDSGGGSGSISPAVNVEQSHGKFWMESLENYYPQSSRTLFFQAVKIHILGPEVVKHKEIMYAYMEHVLRMRISRNAIYLFVAEHKASDILYAGVGKATIPGYALADALKLSEEFSIYPPITINKFGMMMMSKTTAPILPIVGIFNEEKLQGKNDKKLYIKGMAVFKDNQMVGELNINESKGLVWAINKERHGVIVTNLPTGEQITFLVTMNKSDIKPQMTDGKITIDLTIETQGHLMEYAGLQNSNDNLIKQSEEAVSGAIKNEITAALNKSMALNADIFGFGEAVHRKYKNDWPDIASRWDEIYPSININVKVKCQITDVQDIRKPIKPDNNIQEQD